MAELKPCPIMVASANMQSTLCIQHHCAWWCAYANDCSIPLLAGMFADSEICRTVFEKQEGGADNA